MTPTVCLTFDVDAISLWLARGITTPGPVSRGEFAIHALPRILALLDRHGVRSTFFIPVHTMQTFPDACRAIADAGHELALHGDRHEPVSALAAGAELEVAKRGVEAIAAITGSPPVGHRTPSFDFSDATVDVLVELGLRYDSSLMGTDMSATLLRRGDVDDVGGPFSFGPTTDIVELPVSWSLDDYPHLEFFRSADWVMPGLQNPASMIDAFLGDVRYLCEREREGFLVLTFHPEAIGRGGRMLQLERLIEESAGMGASFAACDGVAASERARLVGV